MSSRKNKFSSALRHLNSNQIDEKIKKLEEQPTNNTSGIYTLSPPDPAADPTVYTPSYQDVTILTPDFAIGEDPDNATEAADTSGLFNAEGVSLTAAPPGDNSYILGPMATMYYAWASRSQIGYIRQSDRRMVNLGWISGNFGDWDGSEAAFTSYGQLTLEQAQWYRTIGKKDGADNSTENYRAFYPGPPSSVADEFGRYLCTITGDPKDIDNSYASSTTGPKNGPMNPNDNFAAQKKKEEDEEEDKKKDDKDKDKDKDKSEWDELMKKAREIDAQSKKTADYLNSQGVGQDQAAAMAVPLLAPWLVKSLVAAAGFMTLEQLRQAVSNWSGVYQSSDIDIDDYDWAGEAQKARERDQADSREANQRVSDAQDQLNDAQASGNQDAVDRAQEALNNAQKRKDATDKRVAANKKARRKHQKQQDQKNNDASSSQSKPWENDINWGRDPTWSGRGRSGGLNLPNSYKPHGLNLSESKKIRIMKTLKEPVVLPEGKKKSYKVRPGRRGKTDFKGMDKLIGDTKIEKTFKQPQDIWNKDWHGYNQRTSQGKKNVVLELIGQSTDAFNYMLTDSKKMNAKQMDEFWGLHPEMHSYVYNGKKYKTLRKEELKGDVLVFLVDEKGIKTSILQSQLNDQLAQEHDQELLDEYNKLNPKKEPIDYKKDPLIKKVMGRLKNEIDYPDKPARKGYPNKPPPKMVNGMHPKLGKNYKYDKLDPVSAVMMSRAPTGDPEIDANVRKAARKPK